jgi:Tetracyclin repressor-like, C-terminal domain
MALLGSLLAEEDRHPELIGRFRDRLVKPRRTMLAQALASGVRAGELAAQTDLDATVSLLIGSFYAIYVSRGRVPKDWPQRIPLRALAIAMNAHRVLERRRAGSVRPGRSAADRRSGTSPGTLRP